MDCLAQAIKVQEIWCMRIGQREILKSWILCHFVSSNAISLHDFKLILCMLGRLHKLQYEIRKSIPRGPKRVSNSVYLKNY
jgi:hypothetical protein